MKKISVLLAFLIVVGICIPAVSAVAYNETIIETEDILSSYIVSSTYSGGLESGTFLIELYPAESIANSELKSITYKGTSWPDNNKIFHAGTHASILNSMQSYAWDNVPLKYGGNVVGHADIGFYRYGVDKNLVTWYIWFNEQPDLSGLKGLVTLIPDFSNYEYSDWNVYTTRPTPNVPELDHYAILKATGVSYTRVPGYQLVGEDANYAIFWSHWKCQYEVSDNYTIGGESFFDLNINRNVDGEAYYSHIFIKTNDDTIFYDDLNTEDIALPLLSERQMPYQLSIKNVATGTWFNRTIGRALDIPVTPPPAAVTVYVRNSQTVALLANAHIVINASVNNEFYEVVNETLPSGIYSIDLQPTGGGMPNPDFYRLIVTAEGYNSIMPYIDFEVDGATSIYAYLDPIGGAPEDENNTFIDFFVRDMSANPISGATVNFGGYTLITNSAGYAIFEVDKNKTYSWIVSKSGYGSLTGNVVIGADPRYTINTVLAPAVTPTTPTSIPTSTTVGPTPTMTSPTGEPVSNLLEWFAAHFGMLLGGGVEIGKIFMWLCFSVPVGVYVGKEAKAGAAGFMAGAGIVTLFFVLIGWVPIWLLVLLALIIGLLYAKIFNSSDTGGGR